MHTEGSAACALYTIKPAFENKVIAKKRLTNAGLVPVTLKHGDPELAVAIGKETAELQPWKYRLCPPSPVLETTSSIETFISDDDGNYCIKREMFVVS